MFTGVKKSTDISAQNTKQINPCVKIDITTQTYHKGSFFSYKKSSVSIDLFNLPPLPDMRKYSTMICEIPNNFFIPDGKEHPTK